MAVQLMKPVKEGLTLARATFERSLWLRSVDKARQVFQSKEASCLAEGEIVVWIEGSETGPKFDSSLAVLAHRQSYIYHLDDRSDRGKAVVTRVRPTATPQDARAQDETTGESPAQRDRHSDEAAPAEEAADQPFKLDDGLVVFKVESDEEDKDY